ncbi:hypothetical protein [Streptomyces sp. TRM68367]|uniref:hypothetical protein n=1 Tax=Streptomyces sp. TRM68367 TaxID=2758415 RepID=UPI00165A1FE2|nr:hypothetical protein [Streptomyces sp. TRM68367]MBC9731087.1 hypothetical protein [Streptomyces sp. TRM68367]
MKLFLTAAGAALALAAVAACSATTGSAAPHPTATAKDADAAPGGCPTAPSLPLPTDFPADLPVPEGAVVTSVEHRTGDRLVVATVVRDDFDVTLSFLQQRLPQAGYALKEGEAEQNDAESNFASPTVQGRWTLRKMSDCTGGLYLTYLTSLTS